MNNTNSKLVAAYIRTHFVRFEMGDFMGVDESPSLDKLLNLEALVKMAIEEKRREG
jgi:hypothetical protein